MSPLALTPIAELVRLYREVNAAEENDPAHICDPQGFPRENLFELRATQFIQTPVQVVMLYTYDKIWRSIWTDGRALPTNPEPQWYGYSTGKWIDDYPVTPARVLAALAEDGPASPQGSVAS